MKRYEAVIGNTYVDAQGEQMTPAALESMVESTARWYVPIGIEHDPRVPPQGRIASAFVRGRADGESEAVAIFELFEEGETPPAGPNDERELPVAGFPDTGLTISHDWTHRSEGDQTDIAAIAEAFGNPPQYDVKKSFDPISVIVVGFMLAGGPFYQGFLNAAGADTWKVVKPRLARLAARTEDHKGDRLLVFRAIVRPQNAWVQVDVILTNPTANDIEAFLDSSLALLDQTVPELLNSNPDVRRVVYEAKAGETWLSYAVRKDCVPLYPGESALSLVFRPTRQRGRRPGVSPASTVRIPGRDPGSQET